MEYREYNPEGSDLRKAQLRMLDMLKFIDKVCKEHNLQYWLDSGTLLGAARHGGFIPWDDDTDICMPREDFLKFKKLMLKEKQHEDYVLQCHETDPYYLSSWAVLRDTKSEYLQDSHLHQLRKYRGLQVDIFPLEEGVNEYWHNKCIAFQRILIDKYLFKKNYLHNQFARFNFKLFIYIVIPIIRLLFPHSGSDIYKMSYGVVFSSKRYKKHIYPLKKIKFENFLFYAPNDVTDYLANIYGNWKKKPKNEDIHTHDVMFIFYD